MFRTPELMGSEISASIVRILCFSLCLPALDSAILYIGRFPECGGKRDLQQFQTHIPSQLGESISVESFSTSPRSDPLGLSGLA